MALTAEERARTRYFLGYAQLGAAPMLALGMPAGGHTAFILENSMQNLKAEAEPTFRDTLAECECVEGQLKDARQRIKASSVGGVDLRGPEEINALMDLLDYWVAVLGDIFNVPPNPFSMRHQRLGGTWTVSDP